MSEVKVLVHELLPPVIKRWVRQHLGGWGNRFEGDFNTWEQAIGQCTGYDNEDILTKVLDATLKVKSGLVAYERDSVLFDQIEYAWPLLAGLMWAAARSAGKLNVLDFGGSLGSTYFQNRKFLCQLPEVRWSVIEQEHYIKAGQDFIQDEHLRFYHSIEECLLENQPNVVLLSSVLQYLQFPFEIMNRISMIKTACLIIDRTPFSTRNKDIIMIQRVPKSIYPASYPMRVFSENKFMNLIANDWRLVADTPCPEGEVYSDMGFKFSFKGILLEQYH